MNISRLFRSTPVAKLPSYTSSEISHSAKKFINDLKGIKNTAKTKGSKVLSMYQKTENYAGKLAKSAEEGNIKDTLKNVSKLQKHSDALFSTTGNPFTSCAIAAAKAERSNIASALLNNKISLR
ncbi:hypothetical protein [Serratia quinivorans]|uniref:hypothetical protein n=1 Tax=Serratia quinivorans TaxID=137545 RepID=UPI003981C967